MIVGIIAASALAAFNPVKASCAEWVEAQVGPLSVETHAVAGRRWLQDYLAAGGHARVPPGLSGNAYAWVYAYCRNYPAHSVRRAADDFVQDMNSGHPSMPLPPAY